MNDDDIITYGGVHERVDYETPEDRWKDVEAFAQLAARLRWDDDREEFQIFGSLGLQNNDT